MPFSLHTQPFGSYQIKLHMFNNLRCFVKVAILMNEEHIKTTPRNILKR